MIRRFGGFTAVLLVSLLAGCAGSTTTPQAPGGSSQVPAAAGDSSTYQVTYAPGAVVVDAQTMAANPPSVSDDGVTYTFPGSQGLASVTAGTTVILAGVAIRKVTSVSQDSGHLVLQTAPALLTDAISSGTIEAAGPVDWEQVAQDYAAAAPPVLMALGTGGDPLEQEALHQALTSKGQIMFTGKVEGFDVEMALKPAPGNMAFSLSATRANVKVTARGTISNFSQGTKLVFAPSSETLVSTDSLGLKVDGEVTWAAFSARQPTLDDTVTAFQVPLSLPIPLSAGPIPLVLTIKANLRIVPSLAADKASSGGSFAISYQSDQGFDIKGQQPSPLAKLYAANAELGSTETVTAGFGPAGFGFGVEFPRMELGILGASGPYAFTTIYSYATGEWTPGTTLTSDIPPCQKASLTLSAIAGYKLQVLGFSALSDQTTLWQHQWDKYKDNKPCTLTGK
jgi:hypothetical protein